MTTELKPKSARTSIETFMEDVPLLKLSVLLEQTLCGGWRGKQARIG
jgi:hypothetical protein